MTDLCASIYQAEYLRSSRAITHAHACDTHAPPGYRHLCGESYALTVRASASNLFLQEVPPEGLTCTYHHRPGGLALRSGRRSNSADRSCAERTGAGEGHARLVLNASLPPRFPCIDRWEAVDVMQLTRRPADAARSAEGITSEQFLVKSPIGELPAGRVAPNSPAAGNGAFSLR